MFSLKGFLVLFCGLLNIMTVHVLCDDIIVDAKLNCSLLKDRGIAKVNVLSDAQLKAKLYCKNDNFSYTMGKHQISLRIELTKDEGRFCQLEYVPEQKAYQAVMTLHRIIKDTELTLSRYKLICEEDNTTSAIVSVGVNNPFQSPQVLEHFCDGSSCDNDIYIDIDLEVRNIFGKRLSELTVLRKVQLYVNASLNYTGIQARECIMKTDEELTILKGGCGTGFLFKNNVGFNTLGKSAESHFFLVPAIISPTATFSCKFRVCSTNCDGNSCGSSSKGRILLQSRKP